MRARGSRAVDVAGEFEFFWRMWSFMGSRLSITPPGDYVLWRDVCSYGYFLLWPNFWDPRGGTFSRVMNLTGGPARVTISQGGGTRGGGKSGRGSGHAFGDVRPGTALACVFDRALTAGEKKEVRGQIARMLRLDEDEAHVAAFHKVDPRWKKSGRARLFRSPSFFEDVLKTVTSCNVTWPGTLSMNRRLCEVVGEGGGFPSARVLARQRASLLRARCRVGYRDARIVELAKLFVAGKKGGVDSEWFEDPATSDGAIHRALIELPGIGPYAAANIMQLLGRYSRLPLDTESVRHGRAVLGFKGSSAQVMKRVHAHFAPFGGQAFRSYWFEMWVHYEKKAGAAHTWERDTTGRVFTAANMNKK
ncbi:MAG: hypothetical protein JNL50_02770 [Phycisphaerae bacterium]|nr:hypothetical protein [Phycisphaerae bacterium]